MRAERLDPAKNALRGLEAFRLLLDRRPDLQGSLLHIACFVPTRSAVEEYQSYATEVERAVGCINRRYPDSVRVYPGDDHERALGLLSRAEVVVINSILDGMNLTAEEATLVNEVDGVLVLTEGVGCTGFFDHDAVIVEDARNVGLTTRALEAAIEMPVDERARRAARLRAAVHTSEERLMGRLMTDLRLIESGSSPATPW